MTQEWHEDRGGRANGGGLLFGLILIGVGLVLLITQTTNVDLGRYFDWPWFVIMPGLLLLVIGLAVPNEGGLGAAIPGAIITSVGLLLAYQDATDTYASWAYAWALVAPGSVGAALFLYGLLHARLDLVDAGLRTAAVGLGLFVGFGLFFEDVVDLGEGNNGGALRDALPIMAVVMGVIIVVLNIVPRPRHDSTGAADDPK
jgi:hypothetical protein